MADERRNLALNKLFPTLNNVPNHLSIWLSHEYSVAYWKPRLDQWQAKIDELRVWTKTLGWLDRRAYSGWLDYYQGQLDSAWSELRTHKEKDHMDDYDRRQQAELEAMKEFAEKNSFPEPPKLNH